MERIEHILSDGKKVIGYIHENLGKLGKGAYGLRPAIVVLPGGGYSYRSMRENEPIVLEFLSRGYQVFVLEYACGEEIRKGLVPERECAEALIWIRENSEALDTDKDKVALMGFSAGGHAALSLSCHHEKYGLQARPDAVVLAYPVVTMGEYTHQGTHDNITGGDKEKEKYYSLETQVTSSIPPVFLWHTTQDRSVPPMNSISLLLSLEKVGAVYEYHLFQKGKHGLSTCRNEVGSPEERTEAWIVLADSWLKDLFSFRQ